MQSKIFDLPNQDSNQITLTFWFVVIFPQNPLKLSFKNLRPFLLGPDTLSGDQKKHQKRGYSITSSINIKFIFSNCADIRCVHLTQTLHCIVSLTLGSL